MTMDQNLCWSPPVSALALHPETDAITLTQLRLGFHHIWMNKSSSWYNIHGKNSTVWARFIIVLTSYHNLDCTTCNVAPTRCYFSISYANLSSTMSYSDEHWSHWTCASNTCQGYIISVTSDNFIFFSGLYGVAVLLALPSSCRGETRLLQSWDTDCTAATQVHLPGWLLYQEARCVCVWIVV